MSQPPHPRCCPLPHPSKLQGGGEPELAAALRAGCPVAARLLVDAVLRRLDELLRTPCDDRAHRTPEPVPEELLGACWLALAGWPPTSAPLVDRVAASLLAQLRREQALAALPRVDEQLASPSPGRDAAALVERCERLTLVSADEASLLRDLYLTGLDAGTVGLRRGISAALVRTRCHRLLRRLRRQLHPSRRSGTENLTRDLLGSRNPRQHSGNWHLASGDTRPEAA